MSPGFSQWRLRYWINATFLLKELKQNSKNILFQPILLFSFYSSASIKEQKIAAGDLAWFKKQKHVKPHFFIHIKFYKLFRIIGFFALCATIIFFQYKFDHYGPFILNWGTVLFAEYEGQSLFFYVNGWIIHCLFVTP